MGGIVTLGALTQYEWITTAVSLMGSPAYVEFLISSSHLCVKRKLNFLSQKNKSISSAKN
ncbi:hypothetical protein PO124_35075 [Bacillus licheniformis]|nr:hypothetical protein [Bacillus licheniformis]